jgi:hypothetical protein
LAADGHACPVCAAEAPLHDVVDFNRSCEEHRGKFLPLTGEAVYYCLCRNCGYLFAPMFQDWTREQFLERIYNDDYVAVDPDYLEARPQQNRQVLNEMLGAQKGRFTHLDFGGGDGHLSRLLREDGWDSASWDPFFEPGSSLDGRRFDFITAFEVFEHAPDPHLMMRQIASAAHEGTFIFYSTFVHDRAVRANERISWWYVGPRNGHVGVFSRYSLSLLGDRHGFKHGSFTDYQHCYCREIPEWARHLIS